MKRCRIVDKISSGGATHCLGERGQPCRDALLVGGIEARDERRRFDSFRSAAMHLPRVVPVFVARVGQVGRDGPTLRPCT